MRRIGFLVLCLTELCAFGPAPPYDSSALPEAAATRQHLLNQCQVKSASFKTVRASVDCSLAAHKAYALAEKLRDMHLFTAYAAKVWRIADDLDARRIAPADAQKQSAAARTEYEGTVAKYYADYQARAVASRTGPPFDRAALPGGAKTHEAAVKNCGSWSGRDIVPARMACIATADKNFTATIKLQDVDLFYGYASFLRVDAVDTQDGKREPGQMAARQQTLWSDFLRTLDQDYAAWQSHQTKGAGH